MIHLKRPLISGNVRKRDGMEREYRYDNIKALLIFLVVLGHVLENCLLGGLKTIYIIIYSFHMPMFVFISGMFSKFEPGKIVRKLAVPYVIFQTLSRMLNMGNGTLQYTTPIWNLWYLVALIVWRLMVPFIDRKEGRMRTAILAGSVIVALVAGFDDTVGYYMSLSRIIVFFPFFVLGFYWRKYRCFESFFDKIRREYAIIALAAVCIIICFISDKVDPRWLYGSYSYAEAGYNPGYRLMFMVFGLVICMAVLKLSSDEKTLFSGIGKRSMQIYLLHGFAVALLKRVGNVWKSLGESKMFAVAVMVTMAIVAVMSVDFRRRLREK